MRKPVKRYEDTAANWAADNPTLPPGWEGVESDTGRWKQGPGRWNSLPYSGSGIILLSSTTINFMAGPKQDFFTVPAGKYSIPTEAVLRQVSADLASTASAISLGFDAGASDSQLVFNRSDLNFISIARHVISRTNAAPSGFDCAARQRGEETERFGCIVTDPDTVATGIIDVFGYLMNA